MKKAIVLLLALHMFLFLAACSGGKSTDAEPTNTTSWNGLSTNGSSSYSESSVNSNENSFIGTWETCAISEDSMKIVIDDSTVTISLDGNSLGSSYTTTQDAKYSYLLLDMAGEKMALVMISDSLIGMISEVQDDSSPFKLTIEGTTYSGEIYYSALFAKSGSHTNQWPLNASMEDVLGYSSVSFQYYADTGLMFFSADGHVSAMYVHNANSYIYVECIGLLTASGISDAVKTNHNFCITDWK